MTDTPVDQPEPIADYVTALNLPSDMSARSPEVTERVEEFLVSFQSQRATRNFLPGLVLSMLALVEKVLAHDGITSNGGGIDAYTRQTTNARGGHVNTLNVILDDQSTVRLRPLYTLCST